jgi:hypothetical protein
MLWAIKINVKESNEINNSKVYEENMITNSNNNTITNESNDIKQSQSTLSLINKLDSLIVNSFAYILLTLDKSLLESNINALELDACPGVILVKN